MTAGGIAGCQGRRLNPMLRHCLILSLLVLPATAYADTPAPLPPAVRDMLAAAIASGNDTDIDTVARIAKQTNPDAAPEVDALVNGYREQKNKDNEEHIRHADAFDLWKGKGEFGLLRSTGSSSEFGVSGSLTLTRQGLHWRHVLRAHADYRRANGETSQEHFLFAYEPLVQINDKARSEEHTSELQSLMRISYAVFCLK